MHDRRHVRADGAGTRDERARARVLQRREQPERLAHPPGDRNGARRPHALRRTVVQLRKRRYGTTNDHTFTVTNTGSAVATSLVPTALSAPYSFKGGSYPGTAGSCGASLAGSNTTCTIVVTFAPRRGPRDERARARLLRRREQPERVAHDPGDRRAPAVLAISDGPLFDYGTDADGTINDHTFTVSNTGSASATSVAATALSAPYSFKGGTYPGTGGNCAATLAGSATCTIVVTYAPTAPGFTTTALALAYFDGANNQNVSRTIQGTGEAPAVLAESPTARCSTTGATPTGPATTTRSPVTNHRRRPATSIVPTALSAPSRFKGRAARGTGGNCAASLAGSSATCTIVVTYAPTAPGLTTSALALAYFDGASNQNVSRRSRAPVSLPR